MPKQRKGDARECPPGVTPCEPQRPRGMNRFKMEAAGEVGVNLKQGYNGDLTSRQAGSVGGQMVKKMSTVRTMSFVRLSRTSARARGGGYIRGGDESLIVGKGRIEFCFDMSFLFCRGNVSPMKRACNHRPFQPTPSSWRATSNGGLRAVAQPISTHALLAEGDPRR